MDDGTQTLATLPLAQAHVDAGARMVPFAGYSMPVQYPTGVMAEHQHTRAHCGLFDVSHMGQVILRAETVEAAARALETLVPVDVLGLGEGRQRYGFFTNDSGGILDDLMIANRGDHLFLVVNAARKADDIALLRDALPPLGVEVDVIEDRVLLAVQGPEAGAVVAALDPRADDMRFMDVGGLTLAGAEAWASRSGYTGEDGFEISVQVSQARAVFDALCADERVALIGLARAGFAAAGGRSLPLRPRYRHGDVAGRSPPDLGHAEGPAPRRGPGRWLPGRGPDWQGTRRRRREGSASACAPRPGHRCAKACCCSTPSRAARRSGR